ncbi:hypothetical protein ACHAXT_002753 [Thalassiosira profunda]
MISATSLDGSDAAGDVEAPSVRRDVPILEAKLVVDASFVANTSGAGGGDEAPSATEEDKEPSTASNAVAAKSASKVMEVDARTRRAMEAAVFLVFIALIAAIGAADSIVAFRVCFGTILFALAGIQLRAAVVLYINRANTMLELAQPVGLAILACAGAAATAGAFAMAFPEHSAACAVRQPIILTCVSLMGSVLVARAWRIGAIIRPAVAFAAGGDDGSCLGVARSKVTRGLSNVSAWTVVVGSCGRRRVNNANNALRQQVTLADSMRVTVALMSIEVEPNLFVCDSEVGAYWYLAVGVVLAALPFLVALLLNVKVEGHLDLFNEFDEIVSSMRTSVQVLVISLPSTGLVGRVNAEAHAYLLAGSLISIVLSFHCTVVLSRLSDIGKKKRQVGASRSNTTDSGGDDPETLEKAASYTKMAKMFQSMGRHEKAVEIWNKILTLFKIGDAEYSWKVGFTDAEINSLGPRSLQIVVTTMIDMSKHKGNTLSLFLEAYTEEKCTEMYGDFVTEPFNALKVFEQCPARKTMADKSFVFPAYSYVHAILKSGRVFIESARNQSVPDLEMASCLNYLQEAKEAAFHLCRAMALQSSLLACKQSYEEAIKVLDAMKAIYDPALHSNLVARAYGSDHCATQIAVSALYYQYLGRSDLSAQICTNVIESILPEVEKTNSDGGNWLGVVGLIMPLTQAMRSQGLNGADRAQGIFSNHVLKSYSGGNNHARFFVRPLTILLKCCSSIGTNPDNTPKAYVGVEEDIDFMLDGATKIPAAYEYGCNSGLGMSPYSILSEICLLLTERCNHEEKKKRALVSEGISYSSLAKEAAQMLPIASASHSPIDEALNALAASAPERHTDLVAS